jgi:hypothetical protein
MQTVKRFLAVCAALAVISPLPLQATDTEAQNKAREALRQKLNELESQPAPAETAPPLFKPPPAPQPRRDVPAPVAPPRPTPPAPIAPPRPTPPAAVQPDVFAPRPPVAAPVTPPAPVRPAPQVAAPHTGPAAPPVAVPDSPAVAKARDAMRQRIAEIDPQPDVPRADPFAPTTAARQPEFRAVPGPSATIALPSPPPQEPPAFRTAQDQLPSSTQVVIPKRKAPRQPTVAPSAFPPFDPVAPRVTGSKAEQLQRLLERYRADEVTPQQYHEQRARILAEP